MIFVKLIRRVFFQNHKNFILQNLKNVDFLSEFIIFSTSYF